MLQNGQPIRTVARHFNIGVATINRIKNSTTISNSNLAVLTPFGAYCYELSKLYDDLFIVDLSPFLYPSLPDPNETENGGSAT